MTFGTIGSLDVNKDIDIIVTKKPNSKSSALFKELHQLFSALDRYLQNCFGSRLICVPRLDHEEDVKIIAKKTTKDIVFHLMVHLSYPSIEMDWVPALTTSRDVARLIDDKFVFIKGSKQDIFSKAFSRAKKYDGLFIYMHNMDRVNSNYGEKEMLRVMNHLFDYIMRKRLGLKTMKAQSRKEARDIFYRICDILDSADD